MTTKNLSLFLGLCTVFTTISVVASQQKERDSAPPVDTSLPFTSFRSMVPLRVDTSNRTGTFSAPPSPTEADDISHQQQTRTRSSSTAPTSIVQAFNQQRTASLQEDIKRLATQIKALQEQLAAQTRSFQSKLDDKTHREYTAKLENQIAQQAKEFQTFTTQTQASRNAQAKLWETENTSLRHIVAGALKEQKDELTQQLQQLSEQFKKLEEQQRSAHNTFTTREAFSAHQTAVQQELKNISEKLTKLQQEQATLAAAQGTFVTREALNQHKKLTDEQYQKTAEASEQRLGDLEKQTKTNAEGLTQQATDIAQLKQTLASLAAAQKSKRKKTSSDSGKASSGTTGSSWSSYLHSFLPCKKTGLQSLAAVIGVGGTTVGSYVLAKTEHSSKNITAGAISVAVGLAALAAFTWSWFFSKKTTTA